MRNEQKTKLILKVKIGSENGKEIFRNRMLNHINAALTDEVIQSVGMEIAGLQKHECLQVLRQDIAILTNE